MARTCLFMVACTLLVGCHVLEPNRFGSQDAGKLKVAVGACPCTASMPSIGLDNESGKPIGSTGPGGPRDKSQKVFLQPWASDMVRLAGTLRKLGNRDEFLQRAMSSLPPLLDCDWEVLDKWIMSLDETDSMIIAARSTLWCEIREAEWLLWSLTGRCEIIDMSNGKYVDDPLLVADRYMAFARSNGTRPIEDVVMYSMSQNIELLKNRRVSTFAYLVIQSFVSCEQMSMTTARLGQGLDEMQPEVGAALHEAVLEWFCDSRDKFQWNGSQYTAMGKPFDFPSLTRIMLRVAEVLNATTGSATN